MHESDRIQAVHRYLNKDHLVVWKIADPYHRGVADAYYSGPKGDLWIEYKSQALNKRRPTVPRVSTLQDNWLSKQHGHGRSVWVVLFTDKNLHFILKKPSAWRRGVEPWAPALEGYKAVAKAIEEHCNG